MNTNDYMNKVIRVSEPKKDYGDIIFRWKNGRVIPIRQTNTKEIEEKVLDVVNNGQVFVFSVGPQMTICSRYENGNYRWLMSSGDSPMGAFEQEIIPDAKDEFVVVDWEGAKRASRFKKFGYEEVGKIKPKKMDIATGNYINEDLSYDKGEEWHLMRKKK